jgi:chemotaxis protein MotB
MSRRQQPESVNHERWLVSYADFITLLFAFFVVMFATSRSDQRKKAALTAAMQTAFHSDNTSNAAPGTQSGQAQPSVPLSVRPSPPLTPTQQRVLQVIAAQIAKRHLSPGSITSHVTGEGLVISIHEAGFFDSGSAAISPSALDILAAIAAALPPQPMRIEGHTDNIPIHTPLFATNWELSTARAATITRLLLAQNAVDPAHVSAAGYAEFHPVADNATPEGRSQNRRVDLILLSPPAPSQ